MIGAEQPQHKSAFRHQLGNSSAQGCSLACLHVRYFTFLCNILNKFYRTQVPSLSTLATNSRHLLILFCALSLASMLGASQFLCTTIETKTLSKPSPKSPLEKIRGAKSSDRSDPDRAVFSQYQYCPNSWPIESTAVPSPSRDTKRRQAKFPCRKKF